MIHHLSKFDHFDYVNDSGRDKMDKPSTYSFLIVQIIKDVSISSTMINLEKLFEEKILVNEDKK